MPPKTYVSDGDVMTITDYIDKERYVAELGEELGWSRERAENAWHELPRERPEMMVVIEDVTYLKVVRKQIIYEVSIQ